MKMLLVHNGLWKYVNDRLPPEKEHNAEFQRKNDEALATIALGCDKSQHSLICKCELAHDAWVALANEHGNTLLCHVLFY